MRRIISLLLIISLMLCFSGCCFKHEYAAATCEEPATCINCEKTEGEAIGHQWQDATCTTAKTCSICNGIEGEPLAHTWISPTCTKAKTCQVCSSTEGSALGHDWKNATCTKSKTCNSCKITSGQPLEHAPDDYTGLCTRCGEPCYELDSIITLFAELASEYPSLSTTVISKSLDYQSGRASASEYKKTVGEMEDCYAYILLMANYALNHPDCDLSSNKIICLVNVLNEVRSSYEAFSENDAYTFLISGEKVLVAVGKLNSYI